MSVPCNHPAVTAAMWATGQRLVLCEACYRHALNVTRAMGFPLNTDDLRDGETKCTQNVNADKAAKGTPDAQ